MSDPRKDRSDPNKELRHDDGRLSESADNSGFITVDGDDSDAQIDVVDMSGDVPEGTADDE